MFHGDMDMGWWMVWGVFMMIAFWGGLVALTVWAIRAITSKPTGDDAMDIAERRFARGEITREEFDNISHALHG